MKLVLLILCIVLHFATETAIAQPVWQADLDSRIQFYQTTDFGTVLVATEKSLYAVDGQTGERVWRRSSGKIQETAITPIPGTDLILFSRDLGERSRLEAVDILTGATIWKSDKVKGDVMQLAFDPESDVIAVVLVKDARGPLGKEFKRTPVIHVLRLSTGDELWKRDLDSDIEMMPARFNDDRGEVAFTLDNYRAPLLLDGRLYLFYEGATSYDARTGKEKDREKFKVNERGLALTEADPVFDDSRVYISGRGKIRAIDRRTGEVNWKTDDLGTASEMAIVGQTLYVRTGGEFTRLNDGETESKGPFGMSAIDTKNGKTLWRFKGADKGLTNFAFANADTIIFADRDDLNLIDARSGKRTKKFEHNVEKAQFVLVNESGQAVVGGREEIAAFSIQDGARELWRVRHKPPGRGVFRIVTGIALRAAALYFRYGGLATSALGLARGGLNLASAANSFRWSGLRTRFGSFDLTTLASNSIRNYATARIYTYGSLATTPNIMNRIAGLELRRPNFAGRITPSRADVQDSLFDRLDPTRQVDKLGDFLLRRKRLADLRGNYMYFYTDLPRPFDKKGLVGVNVHNGRDGRYILSSDPDQHFVVDEAASLLYSADGNKLQAFDILNK